MYRRIIYTWIVLTLMASVTTLVDALHLEILNQPQDKIIPENRKIKLSCRVSHLTNKYTVEWYKGDQMITSGRNITAIKDKKRFVIFGDLSKGQYNLRIQNAQRADAGNYTCHVYRTLDRMLMLKSRTSFVQVAYLPKADKYPECIRGESESGIRENEIVPLCFSQVGTPPIHLDLVDHLGKVYQDGVYLDYSYKPSFVYLFVNITRKLEGFVFRCRARSTHFRNYEVSCLLGYINVVKEPYIESVQPSVSIGGDATYLCKGESNLPILEYTWQVQPSISTNRISYFDDNRMITISEISESDDNKLISCYVRTKAGISMATTRLTIQKLKTLKIVEQLSTSEIQTVTNTILNTTNRTLFTEKTLYSLPDVPISNLKTSEGGILFIALSAIIIFQFMIYLIACHCICFKTKTGVKLPIETEFQVTDSTPSNPV